MNDAFYEHFVNRKPRFQDMLKRILLILAILFISFILMAFIGSLAVTLGVVAIILVVYIVFPYFNVEYEYSLLNHYLDISAIYNKEKRKKKADLDLQKADIIAPTNSPRLNSYRPSKTMNFSSGDKNAKTYSIMTTKENTLYCLIIEPDERMLQQMKSWMGQKMFLD